MSWQYITSQSGYVRVEQKSNEIFVRISKVEEARSASMSPRRLRQRHSFRGHMPQSQRAFPLS